MKDKLISYLEAKERLYCCYGSPNERMSCACLWLRRELPQFCDEVVGDILLTTDHIRAGKLIFSLEFEDTDVEALLREIESYCQKLAEYEDFPVEPYDRDISLRWS